LKEKLLDSQTVYKGNIIDVKVDAVVLPNGKKACREVVEHSGAVAVVAVNSNGEMLLIRQFRYPVNSILWELPAGKLEPGEHPIECAKRELAEETGFGARKWLHLSTFYTTPGFSNEVMYLYMAEDLYKETGNPDDDEFIEVYSVPCETAVRQVVEGVIRDAKTIAGILLASHRM